jgi:hypothetical protein
LRAGFISDGDVFFYCDNRETLKVLTDEEKKKIKAETKSKARVTGGSTAETGVKIKIAKGPASPKEPPAGSAAAAETAPSVGN